MTRRQFGSFTLGLGLAMHSRGWAAPALPPRLLRIELRCIALAQPGPPMPPAAPLPRGSVTVGTRGSVDAPGSLTLRSAAARPAADELARLQVTVANGEHARVRWEDERAWPQVDFVWTALGQGVVGRTEHRLSSRQLEVLPRWPGASHPVRVSIAIEQTSTGDRSQPLPGLSVATTLSLPLDRWQPVARSADAPPRAGSTTPAIGGYALELRITLLPP